MDIAPSVTLRFKYKGSPFVLIATMPPVSLNSIPSVVKSEDPFETNKFPELSIVAFVEPSTLNCIAELPTAASSSTLILRLAP